MRKDNPAWLKVVTVYRVTQTKEAQAWTKGTKARFAMTGETIGILRKAGRKGIDYEIRKELGRGGIVI